MALHVAGVVALFVDAVQQAPIVAQCVQAAPEPQWKWWLGALAPWVGPVLSGAVGIYVAWRVFRWQGTKDRDQWVRDQKSAEWSSLLRSVANVYQITYLVNGWNRKDADRIVSELAPALKEVSIAQANCVFLDKFRLNNEGGKKIMEFLQSATIQSQRIRGNLGSFDSIQDRTEKTSHATDILLRTSESALREGYALAEQSSNLLDWLQNEAAIDLGLTGKDQ